VFEEFSSLIRQIASLYLDVLLPSVRVEEINPNVDSFDTLKWIVRVIPMIQFNSFDSFQKVRFLLFYFN
jgi:hypothetical protein